MLSKITAEAKANVRDHPFAELLPAISEYEDWSAEYNPKLVAELLAAYGEALIKKLSADTLIVVVDHRHPDFHKEEVFRNHEAAVARWRDVALGCQWADRGDNPIVELGVVLPGETEVSNVVWWNRSYP